MQVLFERVAGVDVGKASVTDRHAGRCRQLGRPDARQELPRRAACPARKMPRRQAGPRSLSRTPSWSPRSTCSAAMSRTAISGADWLARRNAESHTRRLVAQLERLGHNVQLDLVAQLQSPKNMSGKARRAGAPAVHHRRVTVMSAPSGRSSALRRTESLNGASVEDHLEIAVVRNLIVNTVGVVYEHHPVLGIRVEAAPVPDGVGPQFFWTGQQECHEDLGRNIVSRVAVVWPAYGLGEPGQEVDRIVSVCCVRREWGRHLGNFHDIEVGEWS